MWGRIPDAVLYEFNLQQHDYISMEGCERLTCYWLANHYCTDSYVGYRVYLLDEKPVAMPHQAGRKCDEEFEWVSVESFKATHQYILSLLEEVDLPEPTILDMEEDMGEGYPVEFVGQLLTKHVMYDNCLVEVTKEQNIVDGEYNFHNIDILHPIKGVVEIDIRDTYVPWNC